MLTTNPSKREVKLAKALVHPDKAVRDETFGTVKAVVSSMSSLDDMAMLKLWKALYYCMWLSDKLPIQLELANALGDLVFLFKKTKLALLYIQMFFRILLREWTLLDQYRVNKFYSLIRIMINRAFALAVKHNWSNEILVQLTTILDIEVLTKNPNGIRYQVADIYLGELLQVTKGVIDTDHLLLLLQPFLTCLTRHDEPTFLDRVNKSVFGKLATEYAKEAKSGNGNNEAGKYYFDQVNTLVIQKTIFELAASESTNERFRRRLYDLHMTFATMTKVPFVDEDMANVTMDTGSSSTTNTTGNKRKQPETETAAAVEVVTEVTPVPENNTNNKKAKKGSKKAKVEEVTIPVPVVAAAAAAVAVTPVVVEEKKKKVVEVPVPVPVAATAAAVVVEEVKEKEVTKKGKKAAKKAEEVVVATTTKEVVAVPETVVAVVEEPVVATKNKKSNLKKAVVESEEVAAAPTEYIVAKKFEGAKEGYFFQKGKKGLGYYRDHTGEALKTKKVEFDVPKKATRKSGRK